MAAEGPDGNGGDGLGTGRARKQWTDTRRRKEPSLYDVWLSQEKSAQSTPTNQTHTPRRSSVLSPSNASAGTPTDSVTPIAGGTIRSVTPGHTDDESSGRRTSDPYSSRRRMVSTPSMLPSASSLVSPSGTSGKNRWPVNSDAQETSQEQGEDIRIASHSPRASRNGSSVAGVLARNGSQDDGQKGVAAGAVMSGEAKGVDNTSRPRTRTLDERRRADSPTRLLSRRHRIGSVNISTSHIASLDASVSSPLLPTSNNLHRTSVSPVEPTNSSDDQHSRLPDRTKQAKRILNLMRTLRGRMSGAVVLRRHVDGQWAPGNCYINEDSGAFLYEAKDGDGPRRTLVPNLRHTTVRPRIEGDVPYLELGLVERGQEIHLRPLTQADFDSWYAAFLYWLEPDGEAGVSDTPRPTSSPMAPPTEKRPVLPPRTSSKGPRDRVEASKSDRRMSTINSLREAPVIKIGKMIYWETTVDSGAAGGAGLVSSGGRPVARRMQSTRSRRWRRISGQLRENGELKLHADADNGLLSVVQLSQLSRCAIQRLHRSVLDVDFCIAIYPQYISNPSDPQPGFIRPIFLSLEDRVLYEVWFVLLRAFTIPQLYGPRMPTGEDGDVTGETAGQDLEDLLAMSTSDMFRMERTLRIRVVEAKMYPTANASEAGHSKSGGDRGNKSEQHGYYAEVLLDSETRGKTSIKFDGLAPLWGESFEFLDLPPVLNSASVVIKRRAAEQVSSERNHHDSRRAAQDVYAAITEPQGGFAGLASDVACGKVEIYLQELEEGKENEKWWPVVNSAFQRVGEILIDAQAEEGVILMARDYEPLGELLHRFSNGLTMQIVQMVPNEIKRISDCLLNIFQVSGHASDWLMALIEEEIVGIHKESLTTRVRYSRRLGSDAAADALASGSGGGGAATSSERELIVRDMNRNAALEANLLFRGNTLLTKALDTHMRRVGKEYLAESLAAKLKEINDKDPDCEVDPNRVPNQQDLDRNWRRLLLFTQEIWTSITAAQQRCPIELRLLFKHIRACADDRYGDFLRSVSFSSVSGFLFLRFFCPAILNPKLFGLLDDEIKPRARRTFVLVAKSLQTLANLASFGTKETWMEPMNAFLTQHRESFKGFINDICYVPTPLVASVGHDPESLQPSYSASVVSAETHLSYTTPMTIMQRLPPTSREGFPSLPYLIDQARAYADLVQVWLEATSRAAKSAESTTSPPQSPVELVEAISNSEGDLPRFHETCTSLHARTQECLSRAERAERPRSAVSFQWEELIDQLNPNGAPADVEAPAPPPFDQIADRITPALANSHASWRPPTASEDSDDHDESQRQRLYDSHPPTMASTSTASSALELLGQVVRERPWSAGRTAASWRESLRKKKPRSPSRGSRGSPARPASATTSTMSLSNASSDTERYNTVPSSSAGGDQPLVPPIHPSSSSSATAQQTRTSRAHRRDTASKSLFAQQTVLRDREPPPLPSSPAGHPDFDATSPGPQGSSPMAPTSSKPAKKKTPIVAALRKTRQKEALLQESRSRASSGLLSSAPSPAASEVGAAGDPNSSAGSSSSRLGSKSGGNNGSGGNYNGRGFRGVDMSFA